MPSSYATCNTKSVLSRILPLLYACSVPPPVYRSHHLAYALLVHQRHHIVIWCAIVALGFSRIVRPAASHMLASFRTFGPSETVCGIPTTRTVIGLQVTVEGEMIHFLPYQNFNTFLRQSISKNLNIQNACFQCRYDSEHHKFNIQQVLCICYGCTMYVRLLQNMTVDQV